jgi:hypothetical protein
MKLKTLNLPKPTKAFFWRDVDFSQRQKLFPNGEETCSPEALEIMTAWLMEQ